MDRKQLKKFLKEAEAQGFTWRQLGNGHYQVRLDGQVVASFSATGSDHRSAANSLRDMRQAGMQWPPTPKKVRRARERREQTD